MQIGLYKSLVYLIDVVYMTTERTTTIRVKANTKARIERLGEMRDTTDDVLRKLLGETWFLPKLKSALEEATEKNEESKKTGTHRLAVEAANIAISALREFVEHVEERSR